jgi:hypothetical protein
LSPLINWGDQEVCALWKALWPWSWVWNDVLATMYILLFPPLSSMNVFLRWICETFQLSYLLLGIRNWKPNLERRAKIVGSKCDQHPLG